MSWWGSLEVKQMFLKEEFTGMGLDHVLCHGVKPLFFTDVPVVHPAHPVVAWLLVPPVDPHTFYKVR